MNQFFQKSIEQAFHVSGIDLSITKSKPCIGGDINSAFICETSSSQFPKIFVKVSSSKSGYQNLLAEQEGLKALLSVSSESFIPQPLLLTQTSNKANTFLVLEYLDLHDDPKHPEEDWERMGRSLAQIHKNSANSTHLFGLDYNNFIGHTTQKNLPRSSNWIEFWKKNRLGYMFQLAEKAGFKFPVARAVLSAFDSMFKYTSFKPVPCLVHGDLWSGNVAFVGSTPVFFDCAISFSCREADLAMTQWGGFPVQFYSGYNKEYPLDPDYRLRYPFYLLYHILNHLVMFGDSWSGRVSYYVNLCLKNAKFYMMRNTIHKEPRPVSLHLPSASDSSSDDDSDPSVTHQSCTSS